MQTYIDLINTYKYEFRIKQIAFGVQWHTLITVAGLVQALLGRVGE